MLAVFYHQHQQQLLQLKLELLVKLMLLVQQQLLVQLKLLKQHHLHTHPVQLQQHTEKTNIKITLFLRLIKLFFLSVIICYY